MLRRKLALAALVIRHTQTVSRQLSAPGLTGRLRRTFPGESFRPTTCLRNSTATGSTTSARRPVSYFPSAGTNRWATVILNSSKVLRLTYNQLEMFRVEPTCEAQHDRN